MKFVIWLSVFVVLSVAALAQDDLVQHNVGAGIAYYSGALKNELVSPLRHSGYQLPAFQLSYLRVGTNNVHSLQVIYSNAKLYSEFRRNYTTDFRPQLQYTWYRRISNAKAPLVFFTGISAYAYFSDRDVSFDNRDIANNYNQEIAGMLGVSVAGQYSKGRSIFNVQLNYGLVSASQRTGYANRVRQETDWLLQSLRTFRQHSFMVAYTRPLSDRFSVRFEYSVQFHSFKKPEYLGYLSNRLFVVGYVRI